MDVAVRYQAALSLPEFAYNIYHVTRQAWRSLSPKQKSAIASAYRVYKDAPRKNALDRKGFNIEKDFPENPQPAKRPRPDLPDLPDPMAIDGGTSGNDGQWQWQYDKYGVKRRINYRMLSQDSYNHLTFRWQSLTNFAVPPCAHPLGQLYQSASTSNDLPMYCFELTSPGAGRIQIPTGAAADAITVPFYRMSANKTVAGVDDQTYIWTPVKGVNNDPTGAIQRYQPTLEDTNSPSVIPVPYYNRYLHEWSDIRIVMNGAKTKPSRVHIKLVKFLDEDYAPRRYYADPATPDTLVKWDDDITDGERQREMGGFWDTFWAHRDTNPLRTVKNDVNRKIYRVLYHRTFEFTPTSSTDNDTNPDQKIFKFFYNANKYIDTSVGIGDALQDQCVFGGASNFGYKTRNTAPQGIESNPFCKNDQATYLMIYADGFVRNVNTLNTDQCASFDLMVRSKFAVPRVT